jgi:hypothetical protein
VFREGRGEGRSGEVKGVRSRLGEVETGAATVVNQMTGGWIGFKVG